MIIWSTFSNFSKPINRNRNYNLVIIFRVLNPARVGQNDEMDRGCQGFVVTEKELEGQGKDCCETDNDVWG